MKQRIWARFQGFAVLAALSCSPDSQPLTQVMVIVDSDMAQIDSVRVRVEGMGDPRVATAKDLEKRPLPRTVAIVHRGGPLGPITVTAEALVGEATLVSRRAELSFVRGRNLKLVLELDQSCVGTKCEDPRKDTCIAGVCKSVDVDATKLSDWNGKLPNHSDAGSADGGMDDSGMGMGGGSGAGAGGGAAGMQSGGKGGQSAGAGGKPAAGSGGMAGITSTCTGCVFASGTTAPHGQVACENGACVLHCDAGYTDADATRGNGCEKMASAFPWKASNLDPSNPALMAATVPALSIDCSATLDLGSGALPASVGICSTQLQPVLVPQTGGPDLVVFATRNLTVKSGTTFRFAGSRPVAFVVYGDAEIDGELDVSATGSTAGPGSNFACSPGAGASGASDDHAGGGGGGGFGTKGGDGAGSAYSGAAGGLGGVVSADASLVPLRGGCSGGPGGMGEGGMAPGGGGGGAIQLSVAGKLRITGTLAAAGGGGQPGSDSTAVYGDGGSGGGSGGAILLEATTLETVSGAWITTNGGGGGEGRVAFNDTESGADGSHSSMDAAPGASGSSAGGNGAAGDTAGSPAPSCNSSLCGGGGGGGGLGRVVMRSMGCSLGGSATPPTTCSLHPN